MGSLLRFSHAGTNEALASPALKRVIRVETLSRNAKALLPPHKCGGSHHQFGQVWLRIAEDAVLGDAAAVHTGSLSVGGHGPRSFDGPDHCFRLVYRLLVLFFRHRIGYDPAARLNVALLSFEKHAADGDAGVEIS